MGTEKEMDQCHTACGWGGGGMGGVPDEAPEIARKFWEDFLEEVTVVVS